MIGCIIQARIGSTRLPGKSMKKINGEVPMLKFLLDQLSHTKLIDKIVVATTNSPDDDEIFNFCESIDISCFRGESQDVLDRHYQCAKQYNFSTVVRITSDNPLSDPDIIDTIITKFNLSNYDYITNEKPPTFPLGYAVEVFSFTSLEKAWKEATLPSEREHVTPYFHNNRNMFKQENYTNDEDLSNIRCTVDTMTDFILIEKIISKIRNRPIHLSNVLQLFSNEPSLLEINKDIKHDGYERSLEDDKKFLRNKLIDDGDN
tara:strand:+ start:2007 stop:2789 length:783 start_codon:yes stop_codon:yes gene_type:complete